MQAQVFDYIEINPPVKAIGSIIWLHGLGADGNDFAPIVPELELDPPTRFIFPNAPKIPVTINNGFSMPAWFDIVSFSLDQNIDVKGILASVTAISELIKNEEQRGIPSEKIVLAGFSQGGVVALLAGLHYPKPLGGIMVLSSFLPTPEHFLLNANSANQATPIFLAHGTQDPTVPFFLGQMTHQALVNHNYNVNWHPYDMVHSVSHEEVKDIKKWLTNIF